MNLSRIVWLQRLQLIADLAYSDETLFVFVSLSGFLKCVICYSRNMKSRIIHTFLRSHVSISSRRSMKLASREGCEEYNMIQFALQSLDK